MESTALSTDQADYGKIAEKRCLHCNAPLCCSKSNSSFCCSGCEAAYAVKGQLSEGTENTVHFAPYATQNPDGSQSLLLSVSGIHCASCIQLIENTLNGESDITDARVNMSTSRLSITWNGTKERADAFAQLVKKLGYGVSPFDPNTQLKAASSEEKFLLRCIAIAGFAVGNLMLLSIGLWTTNQQTMGIATRDLFQWLSALIALPVICYAGQPFFSSAWKVLKEGHTNMDVPISVAVLLASGMSLFETFQHGEHVYFDSATMLVFFLLIGRYLNERSKGKARESAAALLSMLSGTATVIEGSKQRAVLIKELKPGMRVLVAAGEKIPSDAVVETGESELDMSLLNGETVPHAVKAGDTLFAGTVNLSAPLTITITKGSDQSLLSDIVKLLEKAEQGQAKYVRLADRAARLYTPVVHIMGLLTFLGWWLWMDAGWQLSLLHGITVLIITCPCALGLAVPVVQVLASTKLMKSGVLLKSGDALERLATIDTIALDKTGTLTIGKPTLTAGRYTKQELQYAASLAVHSKHIFAKALTLAYDGELLEVVDLKEIPGQGLEGYIKGKAVRLGKRSWCGDKKAKTPAQLELWLDVKGKKPVCFVLEDQLREDAKNVLDAFKSQGKQLVLLSGDRQETVAHIAQQVGIEDFSAALSPLEKCEHLEKLKQQGRKVLMVGDGLNDAPSLASAVVSMSPSTAMDITQNTADIVFQGERFSPVLTAWHVAMKSSRLVKENFSLSLLYNAIAIPLAVMGYATPMVAAIAMSASSLIVISNSFRLNVARVN